MPHPVRRKKLFNRAFTPIDLPALIGWYDANDISTLFQDNAGATPVTADSDPVGMWRDKSGVGNHVTQATGTAKPTYKRDAVNNLSALLFDGGDYLDMVATYATFPLTIIGAARRSATIGAVMGLVSNDHSVNGGSRISFTSGNILQARTELPQANRTGSSYVANTNFIFGVRVSSTQLASISNGVIIDAAHSAVAVSNFIGIGRATVNGTANLWNGHMCEVCIGATVWSNEMIAKVCDYLNRKWVFF